VDELPRDQAAASHPRRAPAYRPGQGPRQTRERVRRHRERRRPSADEIAAERKALQEDREERAKQKRLDAGLGDEAQSFRRASVRG